MKSIRITVLTEDGEISISAIDGKTTIYGVSSAPPVEVDTLFAAVDLIEAGLRRQEYIKASLEKG